MSRSLKQLRRLNVIAAIAALTACSSSHLKIESERAYFDLNIDTFPSKALIYLNGEKIGLSPVTAQVERVPTHLQKIAALPLFEHQFQQDILLEPGRIPNYITINMDIPNEVEAEKEPVNTPAPCMISISQTPTLFFDSEMYLLSESQRETLKIFACQLALVDSPRVSIYGIADRNGDHEYNYQLGLKRAQSVHQAMVEMGYAAEKLSIFSYGESIVHTAKLKPTQDAFNRKVYFEIHY
jgi:outer membrane protein OmpA-like peptidoglycan-associated protein